MNDILELFKELESKDIKYNQLEWIQYTTGIDLGVDEAYNEINKIYESTENFDWVKEALANAANEEKKRGLKLLYKNFEPFHLSAEINDLNRAINKKTTELSQILNTHRTIFEGNEISSVELSQILATEENRERRKEAYLAKNQINKPMLDAGFLDLIDMRKKFALLQGKDSFVDLKLEDDELSAQMFQNWKSEIKKYLPEMKALRKKYAQKYLNDTNIYPWDESYISAKLAPALNAPVNMTEYYDYLKKFFIQFNIDISKMNITYDVFSRSNKSEWGYNFTIELGKDSRILANVKGLYNEYGVLLHETGHGIHSFMTNPENHYKNMGISGIISEGIANLFGGFINHPLFYKNFFDENEVKAPFEEIVEWHKINSFRAIHRILFDQGFYLNDITSSDDVENMYWNLYTELFEEESFCTNPPWAFLIHHTTHPIYLHNYFMGDVTCEMLKKTFCEQYHLNDLSENPFAFKDFLYEKIIEPAGSLPYPELFKSIAGKEFSLEYLL